jgi:hypothetical protein
VALGAELTNEDILLFEVDALMLLMLHLCTPTLAADLRRRSRDCTDD